MKRFDGLWILVTGSTRGIGREIARSLLAEGAGVGIHGRDPAAVAACCAALSDDPSRTVALAADFSDPSEAGRIVREFHGKTGRLDGLVNNAGGGKAAAFRGITMDRWKNTFTVNLDAALEATRESYGIMRRGKGGSIVSVTSVSAHGPGKWMGADYAASKAALVSLTRCVAFEAARFGIRANAVSPGVVETDMTSMLSEEMRQRLNIPLGRLGKPEDVASAVLFLLSDSASYITGEVLHVNGGMDVQH
jgi:3-oxoacyl-[acyl-carrier protein] reductase